MKKTIFIIQVVLTLTACSKDNSIDSENSGHFVDSIFFDDGTLQATVEMDKDSIPDGNVIRYFRNGQRQFKRKMKNGRLEGLSMYYYESGKLRRVENFHDNMVDGEVIEYYESGNKKLIGTYYNGFKVGWHKEYFDNEKEKLKSSNHYVYIKNNNKTYLDTFIHYDETGKIIKSEPYLSLLKESDKLKIVINSPALDKAVAIIGDFNEFYSLTDSSSLDSLLFDEKFILTMQLKERDTIRGIVRNFEQLDNEKTLAKDLYFSYPPRW